MNKKSFNEFLILTFKFITYTLLLITFLVVMRRVNYALGILSRTSIVTSSSFILMMIMMQQVYGNFEIGQKKSKPVFLSTLISVIFADFIAAAAMIVMGYIEFPVSHILLRTLLFLFLTIVLQAMLIFVAAHVGNDLYFKLYSPTRVVIINKDEVLYKKIMKYLKAHDKQYKIVETYTSIDLDTIKDFDTIYGLGITPNEESKLLVHCYKNNKKLIYNANQHNFLVAKKQTIVIDDALLIEVCPLEVGPIQSLIKRIMDILGSLVLLLITLPIFVVVGIAIKREDKGPIFYSQDRYTKDGKIFKIYKFRSMIINAGDASATVEDERITKVGKIIRKLRIDELPQAFNILKGDISLVGPRPESATNVEKYRKELPDFDLRLKVKGGLTGYAQIFGKYNTTPEMKLLLDLKYIENQSTIEDIKLLFQTLTVFVRPDSTEGFEE